MLRYFSANDRNVSLKMMGEALIVWIVSLLMLQTILHEDLGETKVCAKFVNVWLEIKSLCGMC